ncbi:ABC transporter substrate-binding protein [Cohnella massiliensis]|uniref:ABC transporter substrate-binding protein n=1 Tax=Cohnella massiliensis TaxID=1816691 RepID=UPI001119417D|nr:ABC transporter substrate-binding protein [Cohnella massiliensis]
MGNRLFICMISLVLVGALTACGGNRSGGVSQASSSASGEAESPAAPSEIPSELTKVAQVTNWYAEAEHGGQYAAMKMNYYKEAGLDMTLDPGGPQISGVQLVASGKYQFAMASADQVLLARQEGLPIVAVASIFQKSPMVFFSHKGDSIADPEDLNGRTIYLTPGIGYWEYIKKKFAPRDVKEIAYTGSMATFMTDKGSANQGFVTSEGYSLLSSGFEFEAVPISDLSGFNPYSMLLVTSEQYIAENPEIVKAFVEASKKGWDYYKDNYKEMNEYIRTFNEESPIEMFDYSAEASRDYIYGGDAAEHGVLYMSDERWSTLKDQMAEAGLIDTSLDVSKAYTTEFLPQN